MTLAYIGVGSNLGNREENLREAESSLKQRGVNVQHISPFYESEALCRPGETAPRFLNAVFEINTFLNPEILLLLLEEVEKKIGRTEKGKWEPRVIDLDILFYGREVYESRRLKIPHPEIERRWFVLKPMADLAPEWVHPMVGKTIKELLGCLPHPNPPLTKGRETDTSPLCKGG